MSDTSSQFSEQPIAPPPSNVDAGPLPDVRRRPRIWPGVLIIAVQWAAVLGIGWLFQGEMIQFFAMMAGPVVGALLILIWWLFFSRLPWIDRLLFPALCAVLAVTVVYAGDPTIGAFGILLYGLPAALTAWVGWLAISTPLAWPVRRVGLLAVFFLVWGYHTLIRMDGISGSMAATINWRWTPKSEDRFLAERAAQPLQKAEAVKLEKLVLQPGDWPAFRGPNRDSRIVGVKIATDWDQNPPKLLWKHKVGPGWGSFALVGKHLFTQEQWGEKEMVICYDADTGKAIWSHEDPARFDEKVAGPGPRATPTFHDGKLYTTGAAGKLNCFDAVNGRVIWSKDIFSASGAEKVPDWGFSSSPLVLQGMVLIFAGGPEKAVLAYDANTGALAWAAGDAKLSYSSVQRAEIDGVEQALLTTDAGLIALAPKDGKQLWTHAWKSDGPRCVQATDLGKADFLLGTGFGVGTRRLHVNQKDGQWSAEEVWTTRKFSPYFNDLVIHRDHAFGFTTPTLNCVSLDKGALKWKERGYGCGQVLLLADQDLLLVVTEEGAVALVEANPAKHVEVVRFQAIEGKTWNHPVLAHGRLYVRNGEEAACYELKPAAK